MSKSYESLTKELGALAGVERVLLQTGDNVIEAKRRVEYGVHQILLEVGSLIKQQVRRTTSQCIERLCRLGYLRGKL